MALQSNFFGKRDNDPASTRQNHTNGAASSVSSSSPNSGASAASGHTTAHSLTGASPTSAAASRATTAANADVPSSLIAAAPATTAAASPAKLTVGPNIKLKGVEITDCDTLVVEGHVEATMDSRLIHIAEQGAFTGSADIDIAEIHGVFDGTLTVRQKLVIHATGRVTGKVRYGLLVIEEGGQLSGDIGLGAAGSASSSRTPALQAAA